MAEDYLRQVASASMQLARFHDIVNAEFGSLRSGWILKSHVLRDRGKTAAELLEDGVEPREIWWELARDFDIPEERLLGPDD